MHYKTNLCRFNQRNWHSFPQLVVTFFSRVDFCFDHDKLAQSLSRLLLDNSKHEGGFYYSMVFRCLSAQYLNALLEDPDTV